MSLSDLASIGSLVSGIAVLVSLIYLSQQTRQNSKHTKALIQQGRAVQTVDFVFRWTGDPAITELVLRGDAADQTLEPMEVSRYSLMLVAAFSYFEDLYYQNRDGLIEAERHAGTIETLKARFQSPGFRFCWERLRHGYGDAFKQSMDEMMAEALAQSAPRPDFYAEWKSLPSEGSSQSAA